MDPEQQKRLAAQPVKEIKRPRLYVRCLFYSRMDRNGNHDRAHVASDAAKWRIERRNNLMRSIDAMKGQLARAKAALDQARSVPADGDSRLPSAMP